MEQMNELKKLINKYNSCITKINKKKKSIDLIKDQIQKIKEEKEEIRIKLHSKCPNCDGSGYSYERDNMYENGRSWVKCGYQNWIGCLEKHQSQTTGDP